MRFSSAPPPPITNTVVMTLVIILALAWPGLRAAAQGQARPQPIVIDHDPMGTSIGSPPPIVGAGPDPHPPVRVIPDPSRHQIVVEGATPVFVSVGSKGPTHERMRLVCYVGRGRPGGTIRLERLREGVGGDYSLAPPTAAISGGRARFVLRFHRGILRAGGRLLNVRTVYLVSSKVTDHSQGGGVGDIQTVTVLSDDPAAFGLTRHHKE